MVIAMVGEVGPGGGDGQSPGRVPVPVEMQTRWAT